MAARGPCARVQCRSTEITGFPTRIIRVSCFASVAQESAPERISAVSENRRIGSRTKEHATGQRAVAHTRRLCAREKERGERKRENVRV